jgi:hypothetical protein
MVKYLEKARQLRAPDHVVARHPEQAGSPQLTASLARTPTQMTLQMTNIRRV